MTRRRQTIRALGRVTEVGDAIADPVRYRLPVSNGSRGQRGTSAQRFAARDLMAIERDNALPADA